MKSSQQPSSLNKLLGSPQRGRLPSKSLHTSTQKPPLNQIPQMTKNVSELTQPKTFNSIIKIVLVGDTNVGKTALVNRYVKNKMPTQIAKPTIGVEFCKKSVIVGEHKVKVNIWDTAGQERFKALTTHHYRGAHAALLVFDVSCRKSFLQSQQWLIELIEHTQPSCKVVLVCNKCDLDKDSGSETMSLQSS